MIMVREVKRGILKGILIAAVGMLTLGSALPARAMIGGQPDFTHTNVGALVTFHPFLPGSPLAPLCSGTLVSPNVVVTAGHCAALIVSFGLPAWFTFDQEVSELVAHTGDGHPSPAIGPIAQRHRW